MCELQACKLCGSAPREVDRVNANTVTCNGCGLTVKQSEIGQGDAAERWNYLNAVPPIGTRFCDEKGAVVAVVAPLDPEDELVDEMERAAQDTLRRTIFPQDMVIGPRLVARCRLKAMLGALPEPNSPSPR